MHDHCDVIVYAPRQRHFAGNGPSARTQTLEHFTPTGSTSRAQLSLIQRRIITALGLKHSNRYLFEKTIVIMASETFPCKITIDTPLPTARLADAALQTLSVDQELSPLVRREFQVISPSTSSSEKSVLRTIYSATTNRMLRVSVNGFFESLRVVLQVIEELDADVINEVGLEGLERVQGVEQGMTGTTVTGA